MKNEQKPSSHGKVVPSRARESTAVSAGTNETTAPSNITSARPAVLDSRATLRLCAAIPSETKASVIVNQNATVFAKGACNPIAPSKAPAKPSGNAIA